MRAGEVAAETPAAPELAGGAWDGAEVAAFPPGGIKGSLFQPECN